jgi:hypothetical protein
MIIFKNRVIQAAVVLACFSMLLFSGCSSDDDAQPIDDPQIGQIIILPDSAFFAVGEEVQFSAFVLTTTGDTIDNADLEIQWEWWSSDPDVFTVEEGGLATGQNPGEAYCVVEATILDIQNFAGHDSEPSARARMNALRALNFTGRDSAFVFIF